METVEILKERIIKQLNLLEIDITKIDNDAPLFGDGLGLDSIDALEFVVVLENDYNIKIEDIESISDHFASFNTLNNFIENERKRTEVS